MSTDRILRVNELLRREIGTMVFRLLDNSGLDPAAVTLTHVETSRDLRQARVLVSVRDTEEGQRRVLGVLRKHRRAIQEQINRNVTMKYTPRLSFAIDSSIEKGHRILDVLDQLGPIEPSDDGEP